MARTPRKLKNGDSYNKVIDLLVKTKDFQDLKARAHKRLEDAHIGGFEFAVDWQGLPYGNIIVVYPYGDDERTQKIHGNSELHITQDAFYIRREIDNVVSANFGVAKPGHKKPEVPTYFCNPDRVAAMMLERVAHLEIADLVSETTKRLRVLKEEAMQSDEWKDGLIRAREDHTVEQIKNVLMKFRDASPNTLRRAFDYFVLHAVMED